MAYLIDSDVLIEASQRHYGFDFCPGFWDWLVDAQLVGDVLSVAKVGEELRDGDDELAVWAEEQGATFFAPPDVDTQRAMVRVAAHATNMRVNGQPYTQGAISEFLNCGDYYLIAHALAHGHKVVTHEKGHYAGQQASLKKLKIPDVCRDLGIECVSPYDMLRRSGAVFRI